MKFLKNPLCAHFSSVAWHSGELHDRRPEILGERAAEDWINPRERDPLALKHLLVPASPELLLMQPASPLENRVKNEGPELLEIQPEPVTQRLL